MIEASGVELVSPRLRKLHNFWIERRQAGRLPNRLDFDPFTFPDLLPWIILHDVIDVGGRRRYRIRVAALAVPLFDILGDIVGTVTALGRSGEFDASIGGRVADALRRFAGCIGHGPE